MMKESQLNHMITTIEKAFSDQFVLDLDPRLLIRVLEKEIQKKHEAFLQIQLASRELSIDSLALLARHLKRKLKKSEPARESGRGEQGEASTGKRTGRKQSQNSSSASLQAQERGLGLEDAEAQSQPIDEEELRREKRRAYARKYYHQKKAKGLQSGGGRKIFKTTPEQRDYQRRYYHRCKNKDREANEHNLLSRAFNRSTEAAVAKQKKDPSQDSGMTQESASKKPDSSIQEASYDALAADRMAIEQAFRPSASEPTLNFPQDNHDAEGAMTESVPYTPKTKLRKAKQGGGVST